MKFSHPFSKFFLSSHPNSIVITIVPNVIERFVLKSYSGINHACLKYNYTPLT